MHEEVINMWEQEVINEGYIATFILEGVTQLKELSRNLILLP